jgi:hypothetical protein
MINCTSGLVFVVLVLIGAPIALAIGLVIRPRIEKVMAFFPNALLSPAEAATESQWSCRFQTTPDFPASPKISFLVSPDTEIENVIVTHDLEILPIYIQFQGPSRSSCRWRPAAAARSKRGCDTKLLGFLDTYLQLRTLDQYQLSG